MGTESAYRAPIWFITNLCAPIRLANAPAIPGVLCPLSSVLASTRSGVLFQWRPVRSEGSSAGGMDASVASWMRIETGFWAGGDVEEEEEEGRERRGRMPEGSHVSPRMTSVRGMYALRTAVHWSWTYSSVNTKPMHGSAEWHKHRSTLIDRQHI